jgi:hypothetical protein
MLPARVILPDPLASFLQAAPVPCYLQVLYYQIHWPPSSCAACRENPVAEKDGDGRNTAANTIRPLAVIFSIVFKANTENISTGLSGEDFCFQKLEIDAPKHSNREEEKRTYIWE